MPVETLLPLELLEPGEWAEVIEVSGNPTWIHRLAEMGVRTGCHLRMLRAGSPCLVQLGGVRLSLRNHDATEIVVRPLGASEPVA